MQQSPSCLSLPSSLRYSGGLGLSTLCVGCSAMISLLNTRSRKNYTPLLEYPSSFLKFFFNKCKNLPLFNFSTHSFFFYFSFPQATLQTPPNSSFSKSLQTFKNNYVGIPDICSPRYKSQTLLLAPGSPMLLTCLLWPRNVGEPRTNKRAFWGEPRWSCFSKRNS